MGSECECLDDGEVVALVKGGLAPEPLAAAREHVRGCEACAARVRRVESLETGQATGAHSATMDLGGVPPPDVPRAPEEALERGSSVGRYIVVERLGAGGMGVVYSAYDPELHRRVALKLVRASRDAGASTGSGGGARLLREAQAIAQLSHPNVVSVHDVGPFRDGIFIALEYVEGKTLRQWLEQAHPWREVLARLLEAGRGLAAAHKAGLVHRDFKPDNVLMGDDGRVRVTDFGLARAVHRGDPEALQALTPQRLGSLSSEVTLAGAVMGTPAYMAPEQISGKATDGRTDQFAFCVTLYQALYGERPFEGTDVELVASVMRGRIREPTRRGNVPGWLHRAVVSGLSTSPDERFPSMDALLSELARDPTASRRRALAWAGALLLVVGTVAGVWALQARQNQLCKGAERRLDRVWDAPRQAQMSRAFEATHLPYAGDTWAEVRRALGAYATGWVAMRTAACEATRLRGEQSEELESLRMTCLDGRLAELTSLSDVLAGADAKVVERAVAAAHALSPLSGCADVAQLTAVVKPPADAATRAQVTELRAKLAHAKVLEDSGKFADSLKLLDGVVPAAQKLGYGPAMAEASFRLGSVQAHAETFKPAEDSALASAYLAEASRDDELVVRAAIILVAIDTKLQRLDAGDQWARWAAAKIDRLGGHDDLRAALDDVRTGLLNIEGKYDESLTAALEARAILDRAPGENTQFARAAADLNVGRAYDRKGDYPDALIAFERGLAGLEKVVGPDHPTTTIAHQTMAPLLRALGRDDEALVHAQRAYETAQKTYGGDHPRTAAAGMEMAGALIALGRPGEGLKLCQHGVEVSAKALGPEHVLTENAHRCVGRALTALGKNEEALEAFGRAETIDRKIRTPDHPMWGYLWTEQARSREGLKQYPAAIDLLEKALKLRLAQSTGADDLAETRFLLARSLWEAGKDRPRARQLAAQARDGYLQLGNHKLAQEISDWLDAHPR